MTFGKILGTAAIALFSSVAAAGPCSQFDHHHGDPKKSVTKAELIQGPFRCLDTQCSQVVIYQNLGGHPSKVETHVVLISEALRADVRDSRDREIDLGICAVFGEAVGYPAFR